MYLREYTIKDKEQVHRVLNTIFDKLGFKYDLFKIDNDLYRIREIYFKEHGKFWLILIDDKIIGTIALKLDHGFYELRRFFILEEYRGKGYGNIALKYILAYAKQKGINKVRLDVHKKLKTAIYLYNKYGFKEILPYKNEEEKDLLWMELLISNIL